MAGVQAMRVLVEGEKLEKGHVGLQIFDLPDLPLSTIGAFLGCAHLHIAGVPEASQVLGQSAVVLDVAVVE